MATRRTPSTRVLEHSPLFGLESECQVTFFTHDGATLSRMDCSGSLVRGAGRRRVSLAGRDEFDLFLSNGGRFYRDAGCGLCNLEYATPECTSQCELIAHSRAGDVIVAAAVNNYVERHEQVETAIVSKCNFDYMGQTSGSHENHLHSQSSRHLAAQLIQLLASRSVVSGGGGFDDTSPGLDFMYSPRVCHLEQVISRGAQNSRAIFTIKDESLAGPGYNRLQLLCSEGVRCEASERLRFAPVALVLRAVGAGARPGDTMQLADPLAAINAFARDPSGTATVQLAAGGAITALEVQHHYLNEIETRLAEPWMPLWAESECALWRWVLEVLGEDPGRLSGHLDWATKQVLYSAHCERRAIPWDSLPRWGRALRELTAEIPLGRADGTGEAARTPRIEALIEQRGRGRSRIASTLGRHGLSLPDLPRFAILRNELFELDIRFGELGPDGLFDSLEREGLIAAGTIGAQAIAQATRVPPADTRAALRAAWIRHLHPDRSDYTCDWTGIRHLRSCERLDLSDPFENDLVLPWKRKPGEAPVTRASTQALHRPLASADVNAEVAQ